MAVEREKITFEQMDSVKVMKRKICVTELNRQKNGHWSAEVSIEFEIMLPDGRIIWAMTDRTVAARQSGRRNGK